MKKFIVVTSIFAPTPSIEGFAALDDYQVVVAGDKKTPEDWRCENVEYLNVERQQSLGQKLKTVLPYNHYCRKMMGYLYAIENGAQYIVDTDDDNMPKPNWVFPEMEGEFSCLSEDRGFVNIYELYSDKKIWPRGLPLSLISKDFGLEKDLNTKHCQIGVWQGLADEDPDVDAIYRLTDDTPCIFQERDPIVLGKGTVTPFNTQNTIIRKELFPLMYVPSHVTIRFTDILRGLIAQPIMWAHGYHVGFTNATVVQERNPHDYFQDFLSEIPMYQHCEQAVEIAQNEAKPTHSIEDNLYNTYDGLEKAGIVPTEEMKVLEAWLEDISNIQK